MGFEPLFTLPTKALHGASASLEINRLNLFDKSLRSCSGSRSEAFHIIHPHLHHLVDAGLPNASSQE